MTKNGEEDFLKDLQIQCVKDAAEHLAQFREALPGLQKQPSETIKGMMKICHTLKGNLQAVGFNHCAEFMHSFESAMVGIEQQIRGRPMAENDAFVLEFFLSDAIQGLEAYFNELGAKLADAPEMREGRKHLITMLATWTASGAAAAPAPIPTAAEHAHAPVRAETAAVSAPQMAAPGSDAHLAPAPSAGGSSLPSSAKSPLPVVRDSESRNYLLCRNGNRNFGIPIERVVEVVQSQSWNRLPATRRDLHGLLNLRGEVIPLVNLTETLGEMPGSDDPKAPVDRRSYIVVCRANGAHFGFMVEDAQQVIELDETKFQPIGGLSRGLATNLVTHFCLLDERNVMILALERSFQEWAA